MDFEEIIKKAKETNDKYSKIDRKSGALPPEDCPLFSHLRTAMQAIECGIQTDNWNNVAEGLDLLSRLEKRMKPNRG